MRKRISWFAFIAVAVLAAAQTTSAQVATDKGETPAAAGSDGKQPDKGAGQDKGAGPETSAAPENNTGPDKGAGQETSAAPENEAPKTAIAPPGPMALPDNLPDPARFVVIELHEEVSLGMASFVERVAGQLKSGDVLVLDINTFGGRVDAAVRIRDALLGLRQRKAWAVAYVHPRAISAGALISLATDIIVVAPGATMGAATPIQISGGGEAQPVEEKTVSYMRKEMRATAEARGRSGDMAEAMVDADVEVPGLSAAGKLLTLDGKQALEWGVASAEAATREELFDKLGYGGEGRKFSVQEASWSWAEKVAAFLTSSMLSGLLMSIGMIGLMIGLYTGGNPVPLVVGGLCLVLFFFGHHIVNLAGLEEVILFALGIGLIVFEIAVPGHILPGIFGVLLVIAALAMGLVSFEHVPFTVQWHEGWVLRALGTVFGAVAATGVLAIFLFQVLPSTSFGKHLLLEAAIHGRATADSVQKEHESVVGSVGVAMSDLRPAGKVKVGERRYDAVAERGFVSRGAEVKVKSTRGFSLVVAEIKARDPEA